MSAGRWDELMIVNPGPAAGEIVLLGQDGVFYRVARPEQGGAGLGGIGCGGSCRCAADPMPRSECRLGALYLGDDGMLYEIVT